MKIAITGYTGFLGKILYKILKAKNYKTKCYSLRGNKQIELFLKDISKEKYDIIINCVASLNPITKNDFFINKRLPYEIQLRIIKFNTKLIHISSTNVLNKKLQDPYTISKIKAEELLIKKNLVILRPSLIIDSTYNVSSSIFNKINKIPIKFYPMIYPGNLYAPININQLSECIINLISKKTKSYEEINIEGTQKLYLFEIFEKFCLLRNKKAIKIPINILNYILITDLKKYFQRKSILQNFLVIDRTIDDQKRIK